VTTAIKRNVVASVLARLKNQADALRVPFNQVLQFYANERFLARLSNSPHANKVLLKGALLLKTVDVPRARPTMDIDLLRQGNGDRTTLIALVRDCVHIEDPSDGVTFDPASIAAEDIAKEAEYRGTRIRIAARMDRVRLAVQIDFGIGDAVFPEPRVIEYPTLLGNPSPKLRAYPIEAAIAEKFQTMVERDTANSRMKDFYDIRVYARNLYFEGPTLAKAFVTTFERRQTPLQTGPPIALTAAYFEAPVHVRQWQAFVRRIEEPELADEFESVVTEIATFVMPPMMAAADGKSFRQHWKPRGPWRD
jgi:hypothetical protein